MDTDAVMNSFKCRRNRVNGQKCREGNYNKLLSCLNTFSKQMSIGICVPIRIGLPRFCASQLSLSLGHGI